MTDPYTIKIGGVIADPYRIAISYGLDSAIGEAAKKLLRCGRKHKDIKTDVQEAIKTLTRWLVIQDDIEREAMIESLRYVAGEWDATTGTQHPAVAHPPQPPEAVPRGISHYAGPTQEQIAERNRQIASNAAIVGVDLAHPNGDSSHVVNPGWLGIKTNMEKLLDERGDETNWP